MSEVLTFDSLNLSETTLNAVKSKGFDIPTPIQAEVIPVLLTSDKDIVGQAQTGTGKTAAFGIPIIERINENDKGVQAIILTPTRELAMQVSEEIRSLCGEKRIWVAPVYGGAGISMQIAKLKKGVHIVVGTPGRVIDHIDRGTLKLETVKFFVLDEADEMLNMGFIEDVERILTEIPAESRQTLLFSATMPPQIEQLAKKFMKDYVRIGVTNRNAPTTLATQAYYECAEKDKFTVLRRVLDISDDFYGIVFCRTKINVDELSHRLIESGYSAEGLHGDLNQASREIVMGKFKRQLVKIMVATDVAARGLDVSGLSHVVNYAVPTDTETYTHRIGRTGRAGKPGIAVTLVSPADRRLFRMIQKSIKTEIAREIIPDIKEIVKAKRRRLHETLTELVASENTAEYFPLAEKLLESGDPKQVVAAILRHAFEGTLLKENYDEISDPIHDQENRRNKREGRDGREGRDSRDGGERDLIPGRPDRTVKIRIRKGKTDYFSRRDFAKFLEEKTGVPARYIDIHDMLPTESYIFVTERDADKILERANQAGGENRLADKVGTSDRTGDDKGGFRGKTSFRGGDRPERSGDRPERSGDRPERSGDRPERRPYSGSGGSDRPKRYGNDSAGSGERKSYSGSRDSGSSSGEKKTYGGSRERGPRKKTE